MQRRRSFRPSSLGVRLIRLLGVFAAITGLVFGWVRYHTRKPPSQRYAVTGVRRANLYPSLIASGRVESAKRTLIRCELENVAVGVRGQRLTAGGASSLLKVIPDGTPVQRGDVLAVLDSSDYEELVRLQLITVERAKADLLQAQLDHEIAKLAVLEFREGTMQESLEDFQGRITLARADLERATDRMNWSRSMKQKGYVSISTVRSDEFTTARLAETLKQEESAFELFRKYTAPKTLRELEGAVLGSGATLDYQQLRASGISLDWPCSRSKSTRARFELRMTGLSSTRTITVARSTSRKACPFIKSNLCSICPTSTRWRSSHNFTNRSSTRSVPGWRPRSRSRHFPTVSSKGSSRPSHRFPSWNGGSDVRYFDAIVKIAKSPVGLRPGMTAQVEIAMPTRQNVLAVPIEAVSSDEGQDFCFVVHEDRLERREVKLGQVVREMTEVTDGLREGEQVVLNPQQEVSGLDDLANPADVAATGVSVNPDSAPGEVASH